MCACETETETETKPHHFVVRPGHVEANCRTQISIPCPSSEMPEDRQHARILPRIGQRPVLHVILTIGGEVQNLKKRVTTPLPRH
jgi:hypothetical protein